MSETLECPFIPGHGFTALLPLSRHLPQLPEGMISEWLNQTVPPGSWLLDPLGSTPALAIEAARAGYQILVTCNNPLLQFSLQILASAPQKPAFQSALAELATQRRGAERLDLHLQSLYLTECANCGQSIPVEAFLWKRNAHQPFGKIYHCENCGEKGDRPITPRDLERLEQVSNDALHRSRALDRISLEESLQAGAKEALQTYLPRPLYFLFTLINKIEGLPTTAEHHRRLLWALLISALDAGNTLWPWPSARQRPRQLNTPPQFRENNLWRALEEAIVAWSGAAIPVNLTHWPEVPSEGEGGICLFRGRLRSLQLPATIQPKATVIILPRPSQAFWTYSAIWSGWLWGREAVLPLRSSLERRRYDWQWHASALESIWIGLKNLGMNEFPVFGILPDLAPGFLTAALIAAKAASFNLHGLALRSDEEIAQVCWKGKPTYQPAVPEWLSNNCRSAIESHLVKRNQPAPYIHLHAASLLSILPLIPGSQSSEQIALIQSTLNQVFKDATFLRRYDSQAQSPESGLWWLTEASQLTGMTLDDQQEIEIIRYLEKTGGCTAIELDKMLCRLFPGLMTPSPGLVQACLESYGEIIPGHPKQWKLSEREKPNLRRDQLRSVRQVLQSLGTKFNFQTSGESPLVWLNSTGQPVYLFYLFASSVISRYVFSPQILPLQQCVLVFPGGRSKLLMYKLQRDPRLTEATVAGWHLLKFRHLLELSSQPDITFEQWKDQLDADPPLWEEATQMAIF